MQIDSVSKWKRERGKQRILERVTAAYGHMLLVDGLFQADAHPGNILVQQGASGSCRLPCASTDTVRSEIRVQPLAADEWPLPGFRFRFRCLAMLLCGQVAALCLRGTLGVTLAEEGNLAGLVMLVSFHLSK